jgi:hypothetical protein
MAVGDNFFVGSAPFDTHPIWNLVNGTPGQSYSLTLKMRDLNGVYSDSAPFSLDFTAIPEPASVVWLGFAAFGLLRLRRRDQLR